MMKARVLICMLAILGLIPGLAHGQGSSTVTGTVTDQKDAAVPGASVELVDTATNASRTQTTNDTGYYTFVSVPPGDYKILIKKSGFRTASLGPLHASVGKSLTADAKLEIGTVTETVEVIAGAGVELQTLDASVGNVIGQDALDKLPSLSRDATAILLMQPMTAPGFNSAEENDTGGQVAGARSDQNTFLLDGGDATSNTEGGGGYANQAGTGFSAEARASVPTPVESLQEFRVTTNNSTLFARSSGGAVEMVTRRGTNEWHGTAYEYNQNTVYNANSWQLGHACKDTTGNVIACPRGIWQDNRFGTRIGGPIWKDKAYFFAMYEGRRFKKANQISRLVPSTLMKQGILQFKDATGVVRQYNLATSTGCGPVDATHPVGGGLPCDPRGLGLNPTISQIWDFMPDGNNTSEGDGLNTIGFDAAVPVITNENFAVARLDYKLSPNWDISSSFRYAVSRGTGSGQVDIGGLLSGDTKGVPTATRTLPTQPRYLVLGLTGRITPNMTNDFHFNYLRHWWAWAPHSPFPQVSGLGAAVQISTENFNGLVPMNIDTQNARSRTWNGKDYTYNDNLTWLKGNHMMQFGGEIRREHFFHSRDDKVVGALTSPVYFALRGSEITMPTTTRPPTCDPGDPTAFPPVAPLTTNCILSTDTGRWNINFYPAVTGMISRASQLLTRGGDFSPNAPGVPLLADTIVYWYNFHFADSWRIKPSLTLTYGLGWGYQTPPYETKGRSTIMVDFATGKPIQIGDYLAHVRDAALQGQFYTPELGFAPINTTGRKYPYDPDYSNIEPRLSLAWNPSFDHGVLGKMFGARKSVLRAGYGRYHDRLNGVGLVMIPALGTGFGNTVSCRRPRTTGCGDNGSKTTPTTAFRIGVDGTSIALPSLTTVTPPLVPGGTANANSPYESYDFRIDIHRRVGVEDTWDLNIQREMPWKMLLEVGYVGRVAHHLYGANDLNTVPYMFKAGGQSFSDAYDAVASAVRSGTAIPVQPWYETMLAGSTVIDPITLLPVPFCVPTCTAAIAASDSANIFDGLVTDHWEGMVGLNPAKFGGGSTLPMDNQFLLTQFSTSDGNSNYEAGYISVRKQTTHGLAWQINYTLSRSNDNLGVNQENVFISPTDAFNKSRDYGASLFDRRHVLNFFFIYDLPLGRGHHVSAGNGFDRVIGGWTVAGQFAAASGLPNTVYDFNSCQEMGNGYSGFCAAMLPTQGHLKASSHYNSDGTVTAFNLAPSAAAAQFRQLLFSDGRTGIGAVRGFNRWNMDASITKTIDITERVKMRFDAQAVNVFNHMQFEDPAATSTGLDIATPSAFGVVSREYGSPRFLNLGLRIQF